jgi:malate dehydrogenase (oxaloacetate-decarboxylating)
MAAKFGIPHDGMMKTVYLVDTKGLVATTRVGEPLAKHKKHLARTDIPEAANAEYHTLEACIKKIAPTALIGLAGAGPAFTEELVRFIAERTPRPIIFPLSNPTSKSEIHTDNAFKWTDGRAIVASGSPYPSITLPSGKVCVPSQGNNMYIFPGIGLGARLSQTRVIPQGAMVAAAMRLAELASESDLQQGMLYPPLTSIRRVSAEVALAVIEHCVAAGLTPAEGIVIPRTVEAVQNLMWVPQYAE